MGDKRVSEEDWGYLATCKTRDKGPWHGQTWNLGAGDALVIAVECDTDTEDDIWCWRVGESGFVVAEGRALSRREALSDAYEAALEDSDWWKTDRPTTEQHRETV